MKGLAIFVYVLVSLGAGAEVAHRVHKAGETGAAPWFAFFFTAAFWPAVIGSAAVQLVAPPLSDEGKLE